MPQPKRRATRWAEKKKRGNKNPNLTLNRAIARRDAAQAVIDRLTTPQSAQASRTAAAADVDDDSDNDDWAATESEKRVTIAYFYKTEIVLSCGLSRSSTHEAP